MNNLIYYQKNRDVTLNRAKDYYGNNKERLRDKNKRKEYRKNGYHNMPEEKKQKVKEPQKISREKKL